MKDDFLIYCNISAKMKAALVWSSSLTTWSSVKGEGVHQTLMIKALEETARQADKQSSDPGLSKIKDLITMIPQHVMCYPMVLKKHKKAGFQNQGQKEGLKIL